MKVISEKQVENYLSDYPFFALPNSSSGIARVIDLGGTFNDNNISFNNDNDDFDAIFSDWKIVGKDMYFSLENFKAFK
jgi:hypothetical protein